MRSRDVIGRAGGVFAWCKCAFRDTKKEQKMNKSILIASLAMVSATVLGMHSEENNRKRRCVFSYTSLPKQVWEISDSRKEVEKNSEISKLKNRCTELEDSLKKSESEGTKVKKELFAEKASQAKPNNEIKTLRKKNDELRKKCKYYKEKLQKELEEKKKLKDEAESNRKSDCEIIKKLQTELMQKKLSEDKSKTENRELKNQIEFLESNKSKENPEMGEHKEEIEDLKNQLQENNIEIRRLKEALKKKETESDQQNRVIEQMRNDFKDLMSKYNNLLNFKDTGIENGSKAQGDIYEWQAMFY